MKTIQIYCSLWVMLLSNWRLGKFNVGAAIKVFSTKHEGKTMKIISYPIEGGIQDGTTIKLKGTPNAGAKRFTINLQKGPSDDADIAFHFDVRLDFDPNDKSVVVCNHRVNNGWGGEERTASHFPFKPSSSFEIEIIRKKESYIVTVDGHDLMNFKQRPNAVHPDWLTVTGDLHVDSCRVKSK